MLQYVDINQSSIDVCSHYECKEFLALSLGRLFQIQMFGFMVVKKLKWKLIKRLRATDLDKYLTNSLSLHIFNVFIINSS